MTAKLHNRGGRRIGAGRRPRLTGAQRLWIGFQCEEVFRKERLQHRKEYVSSLLAQLKNDDNYREIQKLLPPRIDFDKLFQQPEGIWKPKFIELMKLQSLRHEVFVWGKQRPNNEYPADLPVEVVDAIEAVRDNANVLDQGGGSRSGVRRFVVRKHRKPARFRIDIMVTVSQQATKRFGTPVSTRMVETAWKEFRRFTAKLLVEVNSSPQKTSV